MRIYDGEHTVQQILEDCRVDAPREYGSVGGPEPQQQQQPGIVHGINLNRLNQRLRTINVPEIRRRRQRLNIFSQEVLVSADPDRGISFLSCLMILAHYNIISDSKSLRLEEFLRRRYRLQRVEEEVNRRIVIGFFDTLYWSRFFRNKQEIRKTGRMGTIPHFAVPEIFVDDQDGPTPSTATFGPDAPRSPLSPTAVSPLTPLDTSPDRIRQGATGLGVAGMTPTSPVTPEQQRARGNSFGSSPARSERSYDPSPTLRPRRGTDMSDVDPFTVYDGSSANASPEQRRGRTSRSASPSSGLGVGTNPGLHAASTSYDGGSAASATRHRRQASNMSAMEAFDNSAWGESIRRSFTVRRQGTRGRGRLGRGLGDV